MKSIQNLVDRHYDKLFDELVALEDVGDCLYDLTIEVKINDGLTVRKSWQDREKLLHELEKNSSD